MNGGPLYLDASAAVKLFVPEPETAALHREIADHGAILSSELLEVEVTCAARRRGAHALPRARALLETVDLLALTPSIRRRALAAWDPPQRSLDALHLATALELALDDLVLFSYDAEQIAAAAAEGLTVVSPG